MDRDIIMKELEIEIKVESLYHTEMLKDCTTEEGKEFETRRHETRVAGLQDLYETKAEMLEEMGVLER